MLRMLEKSVPPTGTTPRREGQAHRLILHPDTEREAVLPLLTVSVRLGYIGTTPTPQMMQMAHT